MKLTATPFDPQTGELLPVYRDAYLRGDLARSSARAVEDYLRKDASQAHNTVTRWHEITTDETQIAAPNWVGKQMRFIREQPQRFRRRALTMVTGAAMLAGVTMAGTRLPSSHMPSENLPAIEFAAGESVSAEASTTRMVTVMGRILNEKGQPLVGATVLRKGTMQGASTDGHGNYALRVPAAEVASTTLQYGYAGYNDQELKASEVAASGVSLKPRAAKRHWLFF